MKDDVKTFTLKDIELEMKADRLNDIGKLSEVARPIFTSLKFATTRVNEIEGNLALLRRAKRSYVDSLKKEILSDKAGFLFDDN